jgi:hypothetical protein
MTAAYIAGRIVAPEGLQQLGGYKMNVSLPAYLEGAGHRLGLLFYSVNYFDAKKTGAVLLALLLIAVVARSRKLALCWILFVVGILPMAFIALRGLAASWIPTVGLLAYAAILAVALRDAVLKLAGRLSWQPAAQVVLFLLAVGFMVRAHDSMQNLFNACQPQYDSIEDVRRSFRKLCPTISSSGLTRSLTRPRWQATTTYSISRTAS